jgi:hypothetical protein
MERAASSPSRSNRLLADGAATAAVVAGGISAPGHAGAGLRIGASPVGVTVGVTAAAAASSYAVRRSPRRRAKQVRLLAGGEARTAARMLSGKYRVLHGVLVPLAHRLMLTSTLHYELSDLRPDS